MDRFPSSRVDAFARAVWAPREAQQKDPVGLSTHAAKKALQVFGLEAGRRDRVVGCLAALLEDLDRPAGKLGDLAQDVGEEAPLDQAGTGASDEHPPGCEHVERRAVGAEVALERVL